MKNFIVTLYNNTILKHKERLTSALVAIGTSVLGYMLGASAPMLIAVATPIICATELKTLANQASLKAEQGLKWIQKNDRILKQVALVSGLVIGYQLGLPLATLITIPFVFTPTLNPLANYTYLSLPLTIMAYQLYNEPSKYLEETIMNIMGLAFIVKINEIFPKSESDFSKKIMVEQNNLLMLPANEKTKAHTHRATSVLADIYTQDFSQDDDSNDEDYVPEFPEITYMPYKLRNQNNPASNDSLLSQDVIFRSNPETKKYVS